MKKPSAKKSTIADKCRLTPHCIAVIAIIVFLTSTVLTILVCQFRPAELPTPTLSGDKKSILSGHKVLLTIDDDAIFNFFQTENQPCSASGSQHSQPYCTNKTVFKAQTNFEAIMPSPNKKVIGFSVQTDVIQGDTSVGVLYPYRNSPQKVHMITDLYLGNKFISFSPSGTSFVYVNGCWEGMCGLTIKNTETLANEATINNDQPLDTREYDTYFIRWLTDNKVEYRLISVTNPAASKTEQIES